MIRPVPQSARTFVANAEADRLRAYKDSGGVWTIGRGHTGKDVGHTTIWTEAQSANQLDRDLDTAAGHLAGVVHEDILLGLTQWQYGALISFAFNVGVDPKWTLWKRLNAHQLDLVPAEILRFDKIHENGVLVDCPGLDHRRMAEVQFWKTGDVHSALDVVASAIVKPPPSSVTRAADTPPTPLPPKPLAGPSIVTKVVAATASVGAAASQVSAIVQPHTDAAPVLAKVVAGLAIVIVACSVIALFISKHQSKEATQ